MTTEFRRKAPRRTFTGTAGVLHKGHLYINPCMQIGEGGALLRGEEKVNQLEMGDQIVFTAFFPSIGGIVVRAECLYRSEEGHIGLGFKDINMEIKKRIREYVSRRKT